MAAETVTTRDYEPARPGLVATAVFSVWVAVLSYPMLLGKWLANPHSDQYTAGLPFRSWGARWWKELGEVPLWNPELFGGLPFLASHHGDMFHPLSFLRLVWSTPVVTNLGFVVHFVLAGVCTYGLLRLFKTSWTGAVVGGASYQLTGILASLAQPGHDAKLIVSAMLPLTMIGLVLGLRDRKPMGYGIVALAVGLSLLTAHFQLTYYLLIASGVFAVYLAVGEPSERPLVRRTLPLGIALVAVIVGFGLAAIHLLPFFAYLPYSPRADTYYGYAGAVSYGIPWEHVGEFFVKNFVGDAESYWGSNPIKLHSEYLGFPVVALAALGWSTGRRRLKIWLGGIGVLFLLICLGGATPFYRLWWAVMPYVKQTRAPGMAFFVVALVVSLFAAFGAERLARDRPRRVVLGWLVAAGVLGILSISGALTSLAEALATMGAEGGRSTIQVARANGGVILMGGVSGAVALAIMAGAYWLFVTERIPPLVLALALALTVGADLWLNARGFWTYTDDHQTVFRLDQLTEHIANTPKPHRTLDLGVYPGSALMYLDIPQVLGYHGNELHRYDELLGGKNTWRYITHLPLWDMLGVQFVIAPSGTADNIPGFQAVLRGVTASTGVSADLFEREIRVPYARVVGGGIKVDSTRLIPTLLDQRFDPRRVVLFDEAQPIEPAPLTILPGVPSARAAVTEWLPGRMTIALEPAPADDAFVVVAENWYPDWQATVDDEPVGVLRGNNTFMVVPVPAGARSIVLHTESSQYQRGKVLSIVSLIATLGLFVPLRKRGRADG